MAVRYDQKKKDEVVEFIIDYNEKNNGRGGQSAAAKKYKVTPITISNWLKKAGVKGANKKGANKKGGKKKGAPKKHAKAAHSPSEGGSRSKALNRMLKVRGLIEELESEYEALKGKL